MRFPPTSYMVWLGSSFCGWYKMVSVLLNILHKPCANLPSSFKNDCLKNFLCWLSFIIYPYSIPTPVAGYMMKFATFCSWPGEALTSNLYCLSVTIRPATICVSYVSVKFSQMSIYCCGIILDFFSLTLYSMVQAYGMVGAGVLCLPTLGDGTFILRSTLGGAGSLGGVPGLLWWAWIKVDSCLRYLKCASHICANGDSWF